MTSGQRSNPSDRQRLAAGGPARRHGRQLAEVVRALEADDALPIQDPQAVAAALDAGDDFERRIVCRAAALAVAPRLEQALRSIRRGAALVIIAAAVLALLAGAGAARAALSMSGGRPVNIFWAIGGLLGFPTMLLLVWALVLLLRPGSLASGSIGAVVGGLVRRIVGRIRAGTHHRAALAAVVGTESRRGVATWSISALSHGMWTAFHLGALVMVLAMLSARHYTFAWETTILSGETYVRITELAAAAPRALGFPTPDHDQIVASEYQGTAATPIETNATDRQVARAWSGLLIGSLVTYGLVPRGLLLVGSLGLRRFALGRARLDLSHPGYARLRPMLEPTAQRLGVIDPAGDETNDHAARTRRTPDIAEATGPPMLIGLELDRERLRWPPAMIGADIVDLGIVEGRDDQQRVLARIAGATNAPRVSLIVCSLTTTPDRGHLSFIGRVVDAAPRVAVVLTDGDALRGRSEHIDMQQRLDDWRALLQRAGVDGPDVHELDLAHATDLTRTRLRALLGLVVESLEAESIDRFGRALGLIVEHAERWDGAPDERAQLTLHREIGRVYAHDAGNATRFDRLRSLLGEAPDMTDAMTDLTASARNGAQRMLGLLPDRLRNDARWVTAGAGAGALGCLAVGTLAAPVALAALPAWAGVGGGHGRGLASRSRGARQ
jgi:hypothetical protein